MSPMDQPCTSVGTGDSAIQDKWGTFDDPIGPSSTGGWETICSEANKHMCDWEEYTRMKSK